MDAPIRCPSCQQPLRVPADFHLEWLTCPRCRAVVPNPAPPPAPPTRHAPAPEGFPRADRDAAGPSPVVPRGEARSGDPCPGCGRPTERQWLFCPHCEEPLRSPAGGGQPVSLHQQSGRTAGLAVVGLIGILLALIISLGPLTRGDPTVFVGVLVAVALLAGASTLFTLVRSKGNLNARGVQRIVAGSLALAGGVIAVGALVLLAGLVFAFVVCLTRGNRC